MNLNAYDKTVLLVVKRYKNSLRAKEIAAEIGNTKSIREAIRTLISRGELEVTVDLKLRVKEVI